MSQITEILKAVEVLAPLIEQTITYLRGGEIPEFMQSLPSPLKSRIAYNAAMVKMGKKP